MLQQLIEFMFPFTCYSCGLLGKALCMKCFHQLDYKPRKRQLLIDEFNGEVFEVLSAHSYEKDGVIARIIHAYKYQHARSLFRILVPHMEVSIRQLTHSYDWQKMIFLPIPIHPKKKNERAYNQAEELCKSLSKSMGLPWLPLLKRVKHNQSQASISRKEDRLKNISGAFELNSELCEKVFKYSDSLDGWKVCLVDDIITTGATLLEARKTLSKAGFTHMFGLCLASRDI